MNPFISFMVSNTGRLVRIRGGTGFGCLGLVWTERNSGSLDIQAAELINWLDMGS